MDLLRFRILKASLVMLIAFLLLSVSSQVVTAEDIEIENSSGFFGVYYKGAKVGFASWSLEKQERKKKVYYRIIFNETRTIKKKVSTYSYNGTVNKDLSPKSLTCDIKKGSQVTKIKARESGGTISITTTSGGRKMPPLKVKTKKDTTWSYCAALAWAWKKLPSDKPAVFSRMLLQAGRVVSNSLKPNEKTISFQGEEISCVEWTDKEGRELIQTDGNGKLLCYISTTKRGVKTEYISEPEKVAKSPNTFDSFEEEADDNEDKKPNKNKGIVEGDDEGLFDERLSPVKSKADESSEGDYLKIDGLFSIKSAEGWECFDGITVNDEPNLWTIVSDDNKRLRICILKENISKDGERIDPEAEDALKKADSLVFCSLMYCAMLGRFGFNMMSGTSCPGIYKFPDGAYLFGIKSDASNVQQDIDFCIRGVFGQNDESTVSAIAVIPEDDWEDVKEDIYKMLGSFRVLE